MGKGGGGGSSSALQTIATINAINAANQSSAAMGAPPAPSAPPTVAPYTQSQAAIEATRNKFAEGLKGQEADILGGNKKKNKLAAGAQPGSDTTASAADTAAQTTDTYGSNKLGA